MAQDASDLSSRGLRESLGLSTGCWSGMDGSRATFQGAGTKTLQLWQSRILVNLCRHSLVFFENPHPRILNHRSLGRVKWRRRDRQRNFYVRETQI